MRQRNYSANNASSRAAIWLRRVGIAICIVVLIGSAYQLFSYFSDLIRAKQAGQEYRQLLAQVTETPTITVTPTPGTIVTPTAVPYAETIQPQATVQAPASAEALWPSFYPDNRTLRVSASIYALQAKNKDVVAYLSIDGILSEPVLQRDNQYYLTHDSLGAKNTAGALFLDEYCNLSEVPSQFVLHGHNMKDGSMFGCLKSYKNSDVSFYHSHPYITFNTQYENGEYVIFAVSEIDTDSTQYNYLPFWAYSRFQSPEEFNEYVAKIKAFSHYRTSISVKPGDRLLTLSTCITANSTQRLLVVARKIRPDENRFELNQAIWSTSNK